MGCWSGPGVLQHRRGHPNVYDRRLVELSPTVNIRRLSGMSPLVDSDDLVDAQEVAALLGLSHRNSVATYQRRYPTMPRPVVERSGGHTKLWSRLAILAWARGSGRVAQGPVGG
jgi:glutathione-regulated potassium-efflux system ancillary protein KefG